MRTFTVSHSIPVSANLENVADKLSTKCKNRLLGAIRVPHWESMDQGWHNMPEHTSNLLTKKLGLYSGQGDNIYRINHSMTIRFNWASQSWQVSAQG